MKERKFLSKDQLENIHVHDELLNRTMKRLEEKKQQPFLSSLSIKGKFFITISTVLIVGFTSLSLLKEDTINPVPTKEATPRAINVIDTFTVFADENLQINVEQSIQDGNEIHTPIIIESKSSNLTLNFSSSTGEVTELDNRVIPSLHVVSNSATSLLYKQKNKNEHTGKNTLVLTVSFPNKELPSYQVRMYEENGNWSGKKIE